MKLALVILFWSLFPIGFAIWHYRRDPSKWQEWLRGFRDGFVNAHRFDPDLYLRRERKGWTYEVGFRRGGGTYSCGSVLLKVVVGAIAALSFVATFSWALT